MTENYIDINEQHSKLSQNYLLKNNDNSSIRNVLYQLIKDKDKLYKDLTEHDNKDISTITNIQSNISTLENKIKKINDEISCNCYGNYINNVLESLSVCNSKTNSSKFKNKHMNNFILKTDKESYIKNTKTSIIRCKNCSSKENIEYVKPGIYRCSSCMYIHTDITENVLISDTDPSNSSNKINIHKKKNYFSDKLKILQMTKLPKNFESILESIKSRANLNGIKTFNIAIVRKLLNEMKLNRYYKFASIFVCKLNGGNVRSIKAEDIKKLTDMFAEVDKEWTIIKSENEYYNNKSFFGFPYALRKLIELLSDYDEYIPLIKISNAVGNINKNDQIWKIICSRLNYEYIPTY
jgi:ribosomal protein L37AE/L43A